MVPESKRNKFIWTAMLVSHCGHIHKHFSPIEFCKNKSKQFVNCDGALAEKRARAKEDFLALV